MKKDLTEQKDKENINLRKEKKKKVDKLEFITSTSKLKKLEVTERDECKDNYDKTDLQRKKE